MDVDLYNNGLKKNFISFFEILGQLIFKIKLYFDKDKFIIFIELSSFRISKSYCYILLVIIDCRFGLCYWKN